MKRIDAWHVAVSCFRPWPRISTTYGVGGAAGLCPYVSSQTITSVVSGNDLEHWALHCTESGSLLTLPSNAPKGRTTVTGCVRPVGLRSTDQKSCFNQKVWQREIVQQTPYLMALFRRARWGLIRGPGCGVDVSIVTNYRWDLTGSAV